jgi:hypothetical protein
MNRIKQYPDSGRPSRATRLRATALWFCLIGFAAASFGCASAGGSRAEFDADAYYRQRMKEKEEAAAQERKKKEGLHAQYQEKVGVTQERSLAPIVEELQAAGYGPNGRPYGYYYGYAGPGEHVRGQTQMGSRTTTTYRRDAKGNVQEIVTEHEGIYRDTVTPKVEEKMQYSE